MNNTEPVSTEAPTKEKSNGIHIVVIIGSVLLLAVIVPSVFAIKKSRNRHSSKSPAQVPPVPIIVKPKIEDYYSFVSVLRAVSLQRVENEKNRILALQNKIIMQRQSIIRATRIANHRKMAVQLVKTLFYDSNGNLRRHLSVEEYKINQQIAQELFALIDMSVYIPDLPDSVRIGEDDELVFLSKEPNRPYGIYTGYRIDRNHKIHLFPKCSGETFDRNNSLCILGVSKKKICARCDQSRLWHVDTYPHWYDQYTKIKAIKQFYRINDHID